MTAVIEQSALVAPLDAAHEASEPPEVRGRDRSDVRLLVSHGVERGRARDVRGSPRLAAPRRRAGREHVGHDPRGDRRRAPGRHRDPRALLDGDARWLLARRGAPAGTGEHRPVRRRPRPASTSPWPAAATSPCSIACRARSGCGSRRRTSVCRVVEYLTHHGEPIRYRHAPGPWPLRAYQQIFGTEPGSAEMPSAARPFTAALVLELARRGVTDRDDPAARRRVVPRSARDAVPGALPRSRRDRGPPQRGARRRRPRGRGRYHRGPGTRDA